MVGGEQFEWVCVSVDANYEMHTYASIQGKQSNSISLVTHKSTSTYCTNHIG